MSHGEPIALRGHADLEKVAGATPAGACSAAEEQFIERLKRGDARAFERLVNERSGEVYALLYSLTGDVEEARDLTQETFLRAFLSIGRFRGEADLKTWVYRIAVNQARNRWRWWRRRRREATVYLDAPEAEREEPLSANLPDTRGQDPEQETLARERQRALVEALLGLRRPYREVVILRDVEGLSYGEIAATLDISIGTVKSRLSRGRLELRRKLEGCLK